MDATKWTQGFQEMMNVKPMEQIMIPNNNTHQSNITPNARPNTNISSNGVVSAAGTTVSGVSNNNNTAVVVERKERPQEKLNCPRCNSTNTKFCYYNNYSLTQPRYFCKGCRRYWTEGGSLRNVPVGGSSRKNKRSSSSSSSSNILQTTPSSLGLTTTLPDLNPPVLFSNQIPNKSKGSSQDLNLLSFPVMQDQHHQHHIHMSQFLQMSKMEGNGNMTHQQPSSSSSLYGSSSSPVSALELLRTGVNVSSRSGINSFIPSGPMMDSSNNVMYTSSGFPTMVDYKPSNLSFSTDHQGLGHNNKNSSGDAHSDHHQGRNLFPFGDQMKELSSSITQEVDHDDNQQQKSHGNNNNNNNNNNNSSPNNGYWSGMFSTTGGGSSW